MRRAIRKTVELFTATFEPPGPVVEFGSYVSPGDEKLSNLRPLFPNAPYIGCDVRSGSGVDRIEDAQDMSFSDSSVGTVLMFEVLEHLNDPHKAVAEAFRVLRNDGLLAVSVPFMYRLHGFPTDYWRFTASGVYQLLSDFRDKSIFSLGPKVKPAFIFAVAAKSPSNDFLIQKLTFERRVLETFQKSRMRGYLSELKERGRDLAGHLVGRANLSAEFFDPAMGGGYLSNTRKANRS